MKTYAFELRHDGGNYFVRVMASNLATAKAMVMMMEKCPARSIVWHSVVQRNKPMGGGI